METISVVMVFGLVESMTLVLLATGLSLTFGVTGVANFAYGSLYFCGGLFAWMFLSYLGLSFPMAALLSVMAVGFLGFLMYWAIILRIRGIIFSEAIATYAVGMGILEFFRWAGFTAYKYNLSPFIEGGVQIGPVTVDYQRIFIIGVGLALVLFLNFFSHRTRVGLAFRAIAQKEPSALSVGINSDWTAALAMALGAAMAAIASIVILPLGTIVIEEGYDALFTALIVGVVGGLESIPGIVVASFILGYAKAITTMYVGSNWMMVVFLMAIILVLILKPSGLFGKSKELEERV